MPFVVGDQRGAHTAGMRGDYGVQVSDGFALGFQGCTNLSVVPPHRHPTTNVARGAGSRSRLMDSGAGGAGAGAAARGEAVAELLSNKAIQCSADSDLQPDVPLLVCHYRACTVSSSFTICSRNGGKSVLIVSQTTP